MSYDTNQMSAIFKAREAAEHLAHALKQAADKAAELDELAKEAPDPSKDFEKELQGNYMAKDGYPEQLEEMDDEQLGRERNMSDVYLQQARRSLSESSNTLRAMREHMAVIMQTKDVLEAWLNASVTVYKYVLVNREAERGLVEEELSRRADEREAKRPATMAELEQQNKVMLERLERLERLGAAGN